MARDGEEGGTQSPFEVITGEGEAALRTDRLHLVLEGVALFRDLSRQELELVAKLAREVSFNSGEVIFREGDRGDDLLVIMSGTVHVRREDRDVTTMGPGDYFGEISLLDGRPRTATIVADSPVTVVAIGKSSFDHLMDTVPEMRGKMIEVLCARIRNMQPDLLG